MFKSKIFLKAMLIVTTSILVYTLALTLFIVPKVENKIKKIEEKNAKETLNKIVKIVKNVNKDLVRFRDFSISQNQKSLKNLTDSIWSMIDSKYNNSKAKNIGNGLKEKAKEFEKNLNDFYGKNKNTMSQEELKASIITFVNMYRYKKGRGYFWINDYKTSKIIEHPIRTISSKRPINRNLQNIFNKMKKSLMHNNAVFTYKWLNPKSNAVENKISYAFRFKPFDWIISTGEYEKALKEDLKNQVLDTIQKIRYDNGNYFFVIDYSGKALVHPVLEGRNIWDLIDKKGNYIIRDMIKLARNKNEGYYRYWWKKNKKDKKIIEKLSFVKDFPNWKIMVGTGIYLDLINQEVQKREKELIDQLKQIIYTTKFVKTGYLFVITKKGLMLIHPNSNIEGKYIREWLHPISKENNYDLIVNAYNSQEKTFYYKWDKPEDKGNYIYDKVSYIDYIPEFEWYIVSSVYVEELKAESLEIRNFILFLAFVLLIIITVLSFVFFKKILRPIEILSTLALKVSKGDYSIRYKTKNKNNEIEILATKFNEMLDTIETKAKDLEESNEQLEETVDNLKNTQSKLVEAEKMASLGALVTGVAHEINTPVGIGITATSHLMSLASTIRNKYEKNEMSQEEFEEFLKDSSSLTTLSNSNLHRTAAIIKNFKQVTVDQTSEQKRIFNVSEYINVILLSVQNRTKKKNIAIKINCYKNLEINSYPGLFAQIITNLIINSYIHGFKDTKSGNIVLDILFKDEELTLVYQDNGCGISKENLYKIFDPFFTTNREGGGSGLGLNIIYNIITNNLKGSIKCTSSEQKGVVFDIHIPIS